MRSRGRTLRQFVVANGCSLTSAVVVRYYMMLAIFVHVHRSHGNTMISNNSPLEYLAAFTMAFIAGVLSMLGAGLYAAKLKRDSECARRAPDT